MLGDLCDKIENGLKPNLSAANSGNIWLDYFHVHPAATAEQHVPRTDVSPHLIFKNGPHPTLWPSDVPFPGEEQDSKGDIAIVAGAGGPGGGGGGGGVGGSVGGGGGGGYHDDDSQGTPDGSGGMHYPSYFKDGKGKSEFNESPQSFPFGFILISSTYNSTAYQQVKKFYPRYYSTLECDPPTCLSTCAAPSATRSSNRRQPCSSMAAYTSNRDLIPVPSVESDSASSPISRSI